jgi:hypothetical protein
MDTDDVVSPECCPKFEPSPWQDKILEWKDKLFMRDKVFTLFYMPMNFGKVITRMNQKIEAAKASVPDWLCLSDHTSKWNMDLYLAVDKEVPGAEHTKLSGRFYSRVYEGSFNETGKWCEDFKKQAEAKNLKIKKWYMWYTTCPKCAKKYGKNYVVIICEID